MAHHPANLALRFLLELAALLAIGYWGWQQSHNLFLKTGLALGLPLIAALLWATFSVPNDRSRSGAAPVPVPGWLRLLLELALFGFAAWGLYVTGAVTSALVLGGTVIFHYAISYDRIGWLLKQ